MPKSGAEEIKAFSREFDKCEQKMGGGKIGIDVRCVGEAIRRDPEGAKAYVDFYCFAAENGQTRYIKIAAIVAVGCSFILNDEDPLDKVITLSKELGAKDHLAAVKLMWGQKDDSSEKGH